MKESISTFWLINALEVACISICVAKRSAENAMAAMIVEGNCPIGEVLKSDLRLLTSGNVSVIGKWIL